jgi:arginyl-tRNA---protein transferase
MAVLDLLPRSVSAVYFIYHSDVEKWSFGKLSALREAAFALEGGYQYYYMGYYIHSCKKMRYKADFKPQYVLDYHGFEWSPLDDQMRELMEKRRYASMSRERLRQAKSSEDDSAVPNGIDDAKQGASSSEDDAEQSNATANGIAAVDDEIKHPTAKEAERSGLSLLELGMPGVMTLAELLQSGIDLDTVRAYLGKKWGSTRMQNLRLWDDGSETDGTSIKSAVADLAAAIGPELAKVIAVGFNGA